METNERQTCADLVHAHYLARETFLENVDTVRAIDVWDDEEMNDARDAFTDLGWNIDNVNDSGDVEDIAQEAMDTLPLSIDTRIVHTVTFSTGGPADGLDIFCDADGDVDRVTYWYADWFDRAEYGVWSGSRMWDYAREIAEMMRETF